MTEMYVILVSAQYIALARHGGKENVMARKQGDVVHSTEKKITEEIKRVLERNQNEKFLRKLLTRAIILEKQNK